MYEEISHVINTIDRIHDNLWLGDVETAFGLAMETLQATKTRRSMQSAETAKDLLTELRREAREEKAELREAWVTEMLLERLRKTEISIDEAVSGVAIVHLSSLKTYLGHFVEAIKTRPLLVEEEEQLPQIRKEKEYRYVVIKQPPKFEIKALLNAPFHKPGLEDLKTYEEIGLVPTRPEKRGVTMVLHLFSHNEFIEVVAHDVLVRIVVTMRESSEEKVEKISTRILETLTAGSRVSNE